MTAGAAGEHEHRIAVGVAGSAPSKAALTWAVRQAELTGAVVEAVIAWEFAAKPFYGYADVDVGVDLQGMQEILAPMSSPRSLLLLSPC